MVLVLLALAVLGMPFVLNFSLCVCLCFSCAGPDEVLVIPGRAAGHKGGTHETRQAQAKAPSQGPSATSRSGMHVCGCRLLLSTALEL